MRIITIVRDMYVAISIAANTLGLQHTRGIFGDTVSEFCNTYGIITTNNLYLPRL